MCNSTGDAKFEIMTRNIWLSSFTIGLVFAISCRSVTDDLTLKLKCDVSQLSQELATEIPFKTLTIRSSKEVSTKYGASSNLDIQFTNAAITFYTQPRLDSLSKKLATIVKRNAVNFSKFSWVNIIYLTDNGSPISDSTDHATYVFRPSEIH